MHATLCDYISDVVQNSLEAGASRIELEIDFGPGNVEVMVADNGKGMDAAALAAAFNPFYSESGKHDRRRVGLGLPLLRQATDQAGGGLDVQSVPGVGTRLRFHFDPAHVDTPPLGDLPATLMMLMGFDGNYELAVTRRAGGAAYAIARSEMAEVLGDLRQAGNMMMARDFLRQQEEALRNERNADRPAAAGGTEERT